MANKTQIVESFMTKGVLLEQAGVNDAILCRAKYQICSIGEKNRNNRVYEKAVWDKVLADPDISEKLKNRSLFFHAEHPTTTQSNTEKVAGVVTDIIMNEADKKIFAVMEVLDTPYGRIVDTLLRAGCGIGVSTRADGELEEALDEAGNKFQRVIPESYRFVTIDFTADPSTFGSELPLTVERDVAKVISGGLDDGKVDLDFATVLLEKMHSPEAIALLESIRSDLHHPDCPFKASEKRCTKGCKRAMNEGIITIADLIELGKEHYEKMMNAFRKQGTPEAKVKADKIQQLLSGAVQFVNIGESMEDVTETIKKVGKDKWRLYSKDGSKNLGTFDSLEAAKKHEGEVQYFKAHESTEEKKDKEDREILKHFEKTPKSPSDNAFWSDVKKTIDKKLGMEEKYTTSSDKSGQPANAAAAAKVAKKSAAKSKVKMTEGKCQCGSEDGYWLNDAQGIPVAKVCPKCVDQVKKKYRPEIFTGYDQSDVDEPIEADESKVREQQIQSCPKCGETFNSLRQGSMPHRCKSDYPALEGVKVNEKIKNFLSDNWDSFINHNDAVRNVVEVFKVGEADAKQFVESLEASKGKISAVGAVSNEKALPSGIRDAKLDEVSVRLASLTAERDQLVGNYGKDAMSFTTTIKTLKEQLNKAVSENKKITGLARSQEEVLAKNNSEITSLKEQLEKSNETKRVLEETHKQAIQNIQEERSSEVRRLSEEKQKEITELKEVQKRDLIKFYVSTKVKGMGLGLPESVLTILESCKTTEEVDAQIRKTQNALRENLVQSASISEIVIESQSEPNPAMADIRNKVGIALKHFGV